MIADDDKNAFCLIDEAFVVDNADAAFRRRDRACAFPAKAGNRDMMMAVG